MKQIKVVHIHFLTSHKNYYFGSVKAVFKRFTQKETGCSESYLRHQLTSPGNHHLTKKVLIIRAVLER